MPCAPGKCAINIKAPFTQGIFVAQLDAIFVAATSNHLRFCRRDLAEVSNMFETCYNSERDKNCIELRDKIRLCKRDLTPSLRYLHC